MPKDCLLSKRTSGPNNEKWNSVLLFCEILSLALSPNCILALHSCLFCINSSISIVSIHNKYFEKILNQFFAEILTQSTFLEMLKLPSSTASCYSSELWFFTINEIVTTCNMKNFLWIIQSYLTGSKLEIRKGGTLTDNTMEKTEEKNDREDDPVKWNDGVSYFLRLGSTSSFFSTNVCVKHIHQN